MSALGDRKRMSEMTQAISWMEKLLKSQFFGMIKQACGGSVAKYWVTGVLPAFRDGISPLLATRVISFDKEYHSICGFTQEDVSAIVKRALPETDVTPTLHYLKYWYNGYKFSFPGYPRDPEDPEDPTLYNPQHVFVHLRNAINGVELPSYAIEANAVHTTAVLSAVGETGPVTIHDLIGMLYTSAQAKILTELSFAELTREHETRQKDVTWSFLFYLGLVTFTRYSGVGEGGTHTLHTPNGSMRHLVSPEMSCLGRC